MHIKFTKAGKRTARGLAEYLLGDKNSRGMVRTEIKVLQGNPWRVAQVAGRLDFKDTFTHGIIAWSPEDEPTQDHKQLLLTKFKELAFSGLDESRFAYAFVEHYEKGKGRHIHFMHAKVDLQTGLKYNVAPPSKGKYGFYPAWQYSYDALRDGFNHACSWTRPDDPRRMRDISLENGHFEIDGKRFKKRTEIKSGICEILLRHIEEGKINNRVDVLSALQKAFKITRVGKDFISILIKGQKKPIRLKGYVFSEHFDALHRKKIKQMAPLSRDENKAKALEAFTRLGGEIRKKQEFNLARYGPDREACLPELDENQIQPDKGIFQPVQGHDAPPHNPELIRTMSPMATQKQVLENELKRFKEMDLPGIMSSFGYTHDEGYSRARRGLYFHNPGTGQRFTIARKNGVHVYIEATPNHSGRESGSVIDFVQNRLKEQDPSKANLGHVRKYLRNYKPGQATEYTVRKVQDDSEHFASVHEQLDLCTPLRKTDQSKDWNVVVEDQGKQAVPHEEDLSAYLEKSFLTLHGKKPDRSDIPNLSMMCHPRSGIKTYWCVHGHELDPRAILVLNGLTFDIIEQRGEPEALQELMADYQAWRDGTGPRGVQEESLVASKPGRSGGSCS